MSLVETRIQNIRANANLDKYELRASRYGAFNVFASMTSDGNGILSPELIEKARASIGSKLETPVIDYNSGLTIGNKRTLIIQDSENTSHMHEITFATYAWGFTMVPAAFMNNEIAMQKDFEKKFMGYLYKFAETLDSAAIAKLLAAKTKVIGDPLGYTNTAGVISAKYAQKDNIMGDIDVIMNTNDYYDNLHIVGNAGIQSMFNKLAQHGLYNDVNKQNEFGGKILHFTNRLANASSDYATAYAINASSLGFLTRVERECLLGTTSGDGHEWGVATLPVLNIPVGTYFYDSVGDYNTIHGTATADLDRGRKEHYGFAVDVAFITPYNSAPDSIASPIMQVKIAAEPVPAP